MTTNEARWAQIVFWPIDDVIELHRRECILESKSNALVKSLKPPIEVRDNKFIDLMQERAGLIPYWDTMLPMPARDERMNQFFKQIYPYWKPIVGEHGEDELSLLHKADLAICRSKKQPNRGNTTKYSGGSNSGRTPYNDD